MGGSSCTTAQSTKREAALINERDRTMELRSRNRDFEWLGLAEERTLLATPAADSDGGGIDGGGRDATSSSPASASGDGGEGTVWRQQGGVRCSRWVAGPLAPSVERLAVRIFTGVGQEALRKKDSEVGEWLAECGSESVKQLPWISDGE